MGQTEDTLDFRGFRVLAWVSFALLNALYLFTCLQRTAIPGAIFDDMQRDMGLAGSQVTRIGAVYVYVYASAQVFAGMLVDRFGGKKMGVVGGLLSGAGLVLFSYARSPAALYASRIVTALGQSFIYLCVVKVAHLLFPPRQFGMLIGLSMAIGFVGGILGTMPTTYIAQLVGWRPLFLALGVCCVVAAAAIVLALRALRERRRESSAVTWRTFFNLFNEPGRFCFNTHDFWCFPAFFVLQAFLGQKFIQDYLGYAAPAAAAFTMLLTCGSIVNCLLGAPLMRLMGDRRKPLLLLSKGIPAVVALVMILGIRLGLPAWVFLICFILVSANHIGSAASSALMSELTDTRTIAFSAAVRNAFPYIGAGLVGGICGRLLDRFSAAPAADGVVHYPPEAYVRILAVMMAFGLIGFLTVFRVPETRGRHTFRPTNTTPRLS